MKPLPHRYSITASGGTEGELSVAGNQLPVIQSAAPADFGGPGDQWSPEDFLMAAAASCFVLSFRAIATASKFEWCELHCETEGVLDKVDRQLRFTDISTKAKLTIDSQQDKTKAEKLLQKAEQHCLVANSLNAQRHLQYQVEVIADCLKKMA